MHHRRGLRRLLKDDALADAIVEDYRSADLNDRRMTMLQFVDKLTRTPAEMVRADVEGLHAIGFEDRDILHIVEVAAYYAYVNRIADGLGVELEATE